MFKNLLRKLQGSSKTSRFYNVGPYKLYLPHGHKLDSFQSRFPRYDFALGEIARIIAKHQPNYTAIDIGANVGDSAALINKHQKVPVLCIEGLGEFLPVLKKNAETIGKHILIESSFVGSGKEPVPEKELSKRGSFSLLDQENKGISTTKTLKQILQQHPEFEFCQLIKIDTDGFDFKILLHSLDVIKINLPILFWEHDICYQKTACKEASEAVNSLENLGYKNFIIYDNFGNYLACAQTASEFEDLNLYLLSNKYHSRVIPYFDICAVHEKDQKIADDILEYERSQKEMYLEVLNSK